MTNTVLETFEELRKSQERFTETIENDNRLGSSKSFEKHIIARLVDKGFVELSNDLNRRTFENQKQSDKLQALVGELNTKRARIQWHKKWRKAVEDNAPGLSDLINAKDYVVAQPISSKRPPDLLIVQGAEKKNVFKISVKTGGGDQPKLNDRQFGQDEIVIFHSNSKKAQHGRTTFAFGKDIVPLEDARYIEEFHKQLTAFKKDYKEKNPPRDGATVLPNPRNRVDLTKHAKDWFGGEINGLIKQEREQRVIDHLAKL